ncbi:MAG: host-nuclease inhibitor Gam family protein [Gammaproteobacteria bacterium]|nr:host-nuclease inhibitor Gam family protein [Gammaproteobacteria bacterium]
MTELEHIAGLCKQLADAREALGTVVTDIRQLQRGAVKDRLRELKKCAANVSSLKDQLYAAITAAPHLFEAPKTRAIDGIKVGYRKMPGAIEGDEAAALARIRKTLPDLADDLIRTKETLNKTALRKLDAKQLARIGLTLTDVDDEVVLQAASSDLDKLVDTLIEDSQAEAA